MPIYLEFSETVSDAIQSAAMHRKLDSALRKMSSTEDNRIDFQQLSCKYVPGRKNYWFEDNDYYAKNKTCPAAGSKST